MILVSSTRQRIARIPLLGRAHDCVDETGLFSLSYGQKVYAVHTRAGSTGFASLQDQAGRVGRVAAGMPRLTQVLTGGARVPAVLLEDTAAELLLRVDEFDHATWTKSLVGAATAPVVTANAAIAPDGTLTADSVVFVAPGAGDQSYIAQGALTTVASSVYAGSVWIRAAAAADVGKILLMRHVGASAYTTITLTAAWQRVQGYETAAGVSSSFSLDLRPSLGSSSGTVTVHLWRANLTLGNAASSEIPATTVAGARAADLLYFPLNLSVQACAMYVRFVELMRANVAALATSGIAYIGAAGGTDPRAFLYRAVAEAGYRFQHDPATGSNTSNIGSAATVGDTVELKGDIASTGAPTLTSCINGGALETNGPGTAQALGAAWSDARFYLNSLGSNDIGMMAARNWAVAPPTVTLTELRDLCEVG